MRDFDKIEPTEKEVNSASTASGTQTSWSQDKKRKRSEPVFHEEFSVKRRIEYKKNSENFDSAHKMSGNSTTPTPNDDWAVVHQGTSQEEDWFSLHPPEVATIEHALHQASREKQTVVKTPTSTPALSTSQPSMSRPLNQPNQGHRRERIVPPALQPPSASTLNAVESPIPTQPKVISKRLPALTTPNRLSQRWPSEGDRDGDSISTCQEDSLQEDTVVRTQQEEMDADEEDIPKVVPRSFLTYCIPVVGVRRCAGCTLEEVTASVWCCECSRCLCSKCDARMHDTDALDSLQRPLCSHQVEYIKSGGGLPILSPMLEWVVLAAFIYMIRPAWTHMGNLLHVDYFFESVCPIVQQIRRWVFQLDHALYPVVRGQLGEWCDTEDAFLKIFSDLWVRGILTHTDSFALLLLKIPATIGALLIYLAVVPLFAIPYAIVATIVRLLEIFLIPNMLVTRFVARVFRAAAIVVWMPFRLIGWVCRSTALGLVMEQDFKENFHRRQKIPPKTGERKRPIPSKGLADLRLAGMISRVTRIFSYFHRKARRVIIASIITVVFWTLSLRILLLSLPRCGNGLLSKYAEEEMWHLLSSEEELDSGLSESSEIPDCVSIDVLARKLSHHLGVQIPEFSSLGAEGQVLAKMQEATENDYLDDTLQRILYSLYLRFLAIPIEIRMLVRMCLVLVIFSGLVRRILFWMDLRQRQRFHKLRVNAHLRE